MSDMRARFVFEFGGNSRQYSNATARDIERMERRVSGSARRMGGAFMVANRGLSRFANRYTTFLTGATAAAGVRYVVNLEDDLKHLGLRAGWSAERIEGLKNEIYDIAQDKKYRVNSDELFLGLDEVVTQLGDLELAADNIENLAAVMRGFKVAGRDAGAVVANLFAKFDINDADQMAEAIAALAMQGDLGAFEIRDLAASINEVGAAFQMTGRRGVKGAREMGAILQIARRTSGSPAETATSFNRFFSETFGEKAKDVKKLIGKGERSLYEGRNEDGSLRARPIEEIILDILNKSGNRTEVLTKIFGERSMKVIRGFQGLYDPIRKQFREGGSEAGFNQLVNADGDPAILMNRSADAATTAKAALDSIYVALKRLADRELTGPIKDLASTINSMDPDELNKFLGNWALAAKIGLGAAVGSKGIDTVANGIQTFLALRGQTPARPMYVQDITGVKGVKSSGGDIFGSKRYEEIQRRKKLMKVAKGAAGVTLSGAAGYAAGTVIYNAIDETSFANAIGRNISRALAFMGNSNAQAALDSEGGSSVSGNIGIKVEIDDMGRPRLAGVSSDGDLTRSNFVELAGDTTVMQ